MRRRRRRDSERGSEIVEFALIAPILLFMVLAIPVLGLLVRSWIVVSGAAREGARQGALWHKNIQQSDRVSSAVSHAVSAVDLERDAQGTMLGEGPYFRETKDVHVSFEGQFIVVSVTYRQPTYVPLIGRLLGPSGGDMDELVEVTATSKFLMEGPP